MASVFKNVLHDAITFVGNMANDYGSSAGAGVSGIATLAATGSADAATAVIEKTREGLSEGGTGEYNTDLARIAQGVLGTAAGWVSETGQTVRQSAGGMVEGSTGSQAAGAATAAALSVGFDLFEQATRMGGSSPRKIVSARKAERTGEGWMDATDNRPVAEIDDSTLDLVDIKESDDFISTTVGESVKHPELYQYIPEAAGIKLEIMINKAADKYARYHVDEDTIYIAAPDIGTAKTSLVHELQHVAQVKEGRGGTGTTEGDVLKSMGKDVLAARDRAMEQATTGKGKNRVQALIAQRYLTPYVLYLRNKGEIEAEQAAIRFSGTNKAKRFVDQLTEEGLTTSDAIPDDFYATPITKEKLLSIAKPEHRQILASFFKGEE